MRKSQIVACGLLCPLLLSGAGCSDSNASEEHSRTGFEPLWTTELTGNATQDEGGWPRIPVVAQGLVLVGGRLGLAAFDTSSGREVWRVTPWPGGTAMWGYIAESDGRACTEDDPGIACVDIASGRVLWSRALPGAAANCETTIDAFAWYVGTDSHMVYAVDPSTGREIWATDVNPGTHFSSRVFGIATSGDTLYVNTVRQTQTTALPVVGDLIALDRQTGRILFTYTTSTPNGGFQGAATIVGRLAVMNDAWGHGLVGIDRIFRRRGLAYAGVAERLHKFGYAAKCSRRYSLCRVERHPGVLGERQDRKDSMEHHWRSTWQPREHFCLQIATSRRGIRRREHHRGRSRNTRKLDRCLCSARCLLPHRSRWRCRVLRVVQCSVCLSMLVVSPRQRLLRRAVPRTSGQQAS